MRIKAIFIIFFLFSLFQGYSHKQELSPLNISFEKDLEIGAEEGDENYMLAGVIDVEAENGKLISFFKPKGGIMMLRKFYFWLLILFLFWSWPNIGQPKSLNEGGKIMEIKVTSSAFEEGGLIPSKYTCDGADVSPPLAWSSVPEGAKTIALICDDPDAPMGTWVHWVLFNLPADVQELPENIPADQELENGAKQGKNGFGKIGYGGPCPPFGTHRYYFKLYALDTELDLKPGIKKKELLKAMEGHILAQGQLMGKYRR